MAAQRDHGLVKLVHLSDYGGPYAGSFVPMILAVLTAGRARGYEPLALFTDIARGRPWLEEFEKAGIPYRFTAVENIGATVETVADEGRCILHTHFATFDLACARAARRQGAIVFWHSHLGLNPGLVSLAKNTVRYGVLSRSVRGVLCVSPQIARELRRRLAPRKRVVFVPNAIDLDRFRLHDEDDQRAARARLGLPFETTVLMHFGWDWERKGGDIYLNAAKKLRDAGRDFVAVSVGPGDEAQRTAAEIGIGDRVLVLGPTNNVQDLYSAADVMVIPSRAEGMPFAMIEALACGRPTVATEESGMSEIAAGLATCRLTAPQPDAVASAIAALLDRDATAARDDALAARRSIEERLALPVWAGNLIARYEAALADADQASSRHSH